MSNVSTDDGSQPGRLASTPGPSTLHGQSNAKVPQTPLVGDLKKKTPGPVAMNQKQSPKFKRLEPGNTPKKQFQVTKSPFS